MKVKPRVKFTKLRRKWAKAYLRCQKAKDVDGYIYCQDCGNQGRFNWCSDQRNVLSFAATHDIELTYLLEEEYENFHFTEEIKDGDILFSYKLFEGRAQSRNAIKLLELMGYDREIVDSAMDCANFFLEKGQWKM